MSFVTVTALIDGALHSEDEFQTYEAAREAARMLAADGFTVYLLEHGHEPEEDCECAQYLQSHAPWSAT